MPIQIIIFLTKNKLFAAEINNDGKADAISIKGNPDIKCDDANDVDELLECLFDAFSIDSFADENFDIVIVDCSGDKKIVSYLNAKCADATKLSIISIEKLLPLLVWNKKQLASGEEVVVAFADACYKVACDEKNVVRFIGKARKGKENVTLELDDFGYLYYFNVDNMKGGVVDTIELQERDNIIARLEEENDKLVYALNEKEKAFTAALTSAKDAEKKIAELNAEKVQWEKDHPKPSSRVERMVDIVEMCKRNAKELGGDLYIRGSIPKKKLDSAIALYSKLFNIHIDPNSVVALFYNYDGDSTFIFDSLLITSEFFCYDKDGNRAMNLIYWGSLVNAYVDYNERKIYFKQIDDKTRHINVNASVGKQFFLPLFNKMKNVVELS